jgi:hypothetical protein
LNSCMQERWQLGCTTISTWSCCKNKRNWATSRESVKRRLAGPQRNTNWTLLVDRVRDWQNVC